MTPPVLPLRDIHLPPPVSWWPPAPGWWFLAVFVLLLGGGFGWRWVRRRRHRAIRRQALAELARLRGGFRAAPDAGTLAGELSVLLRRVCLSCYPREEVAALTGERWLQFLEDPLSGRPFSEGPGRCLIEAPYRSAPEVDGEALLQLCERWLRRLPAARDRGQLNEQKGESA